MAAIDIILSVPVILSDFYVYVGSCGRSEFECA